MVLVMSAVSNAKMSEDWAYASWRLDSRVVFYQRHRALSRLSTIFLEGKYTKHCEYSYQTLGSQVKLSNKP